MNQMTKAELSKDNKFLRDELSLLRAKLKAMKEPGFYRKELDQMEPRYQLAVANYRASIAEKDRKINRLRTLIEQLKTEVNL